MVVAEGARNRCAPGKILGHKRPHHILLESLFLVHHVVGNAEVLGHAPRVIHIIERAAAACLRRVWNTMLAGKTCLVPKLQREADNLRPFVEAGKDRRDRRRVDSSGHGNGDGVVLRHGEIVQLYFRINRVLRCWIRPRA